MLSSALSAFLMVSLSLTTSRCSSSCESSRSLATRFDGLPELIAGRPQYRVLIGAGLLVPHFAVVGQLAADGAVERVELELDFDPAP